MRRNTFIDFIVVSIMISIFGVSLRLFLIFGQQQRGSAHKHAMSQACYVIDKSWGIGDASDSKDIDEAEWRSMSEDDDQG